MNQSDVRVLPPGSLVVEVTWGPERHRATLDTAQPLIGVDERGRLVTGADDGRTARVWFAARGNRVYAMSVDARAPAHVGNMPLPAAWSPLSLPCSLQLGPLAIKVLAEVDGQRRKTPSGEISHVRATLESPATTEGVTRVCPPLSMPPEASPPNDLGTTRLVAPRASTSNTPYPPRMVGNTQYLPSLADPADTEGSTRVLPSLADPADTEGSTRVIAPLMHPADVEGVTRVLPPTATGPDDSPASGSTRIAPPIAHAMPPPPMAGGIEPAVTRIQQPLTPPPNLAAHFPPRPPADMASPPQAFAVKTGPNMSSSSATVLVQSPPKKRGMSPLLIVGLAALPLALGAVWFTSGRANVARPSAPRASTTVAAAPPPASAPRPPTSVAAAPRAGAPAAPATSEPRTTAVKVAPPAPFAEAVPSAPDAVARDADRRIAEAMFAGDYGRAVEASSALGKSDPTSARYTVIARVLRTKAARSAR